MSAAWIVSMIAGSSSTARLLIESLGPDNRLRRRCDGDKCTLMMTDGVRGSAGRIVLAALVLAVDI